MKKTHCTAASWQILAFSLISCSLCYANPSNPSVVQGSAQFDNIDSKTLSITTSDKAVINWNEFSIAEGELTQFFQPSSKSVVINRVSSDLSSVLLGSLKANGKIFLINPSGILIGADASIDTNSFIASTLSANPQDLLSDNQNVLFQGSSTATITNLGSITAWDGDVYLIGYQVDNQGSINAANGTVAIGAGQEVLLKPLALEKIVIRPTLAKYENPSSIDNSGSIAACRAELKADGNAYAMAINHTGAIDAIGIQEQNGEVYLTAGNGNNGVYGTITASNVDGTGGSVQILGDHIALLDHALVNASGERGGGTVLIGGDKSGANPAIWNAKTTYVDKNAIVLADALLDGNGGKVIAWADETTCFYGTISVRGGENSGDGGFVEISGKQNLDHQGAADRLAPHGKAGTLLLDPLDITINNSGTDINVNSSSPFAPTGAGSVLTWTTLTGVGGLSTGNTIVNTALGGSSGGTITVGLPTLLSYSSPFILTLDNTATATTGNIIINAPITNILTGDIVINSLNDIDINASISTLGNVTLGTTNGNLNILGSTVPADITCINLTANIQGDVAITGGSSVGAEANIISSGTVQLNSSAGSITITGGSAATTTAGIQSTGPLVSVSAAKALSILGGTSDAAILSTMPDIFTVNAGSLIMTAGVGNAYINNYNGSIGITLTGASPGGLTMTASATGNAAILSPFPTGNNAPITISAPNSDMVMTSPSSGAGVASVTSSFNSNVDITVNNLTMNGKSTVISTYEGSTLAITANQAITLNQSSSVNMYITGLALGGNILMKAGTNIFIDTGAEVSNDTEGSVTLVVDNLFPVAGTFGNGQFICKGNVMTSGDPGAVLRIYTSRRQLNSITGGLNGTTFVPGPYLVNGTKEAWGIWYPAIAGTGHPYTILYKVPDINNVTPFVFPSTALAVTLFNQAAFEFLQDLRDYDSFWYWKTLFTSEYDREAFAKTRHDGQTMSSDIIGKNNYRLLRKTYQENNGKLTYLLK